MKIEDSFEQSVSAMLSGQPDFKLHRFHVDTEIPVICAYLDTLVDKDQIQRLILLPLIETRFVREESEERKLCRIRDVLSGVPHSAESDPQSWVTQILEGQCLLLIGPIGEGLLFDTSKSKHRSIEAPKSEKIVRGPQEGFSEDIMTNVSLVRSRVKSPQLTFESFEIGESTKTKVLMGYMKGRATEERIRYYREKLMAIRTDAILESANIEEWVEEREVTPFPRMLNTERPDVTSAHLVEGKIVILTDGTPYCLIAPVSFFQFFISAEDYYQRALYATILRWFRLLAFFLSVYTPAVYIALINYRQEMIPSALLQNLATQREGVPFPAYLEAIIMLFIFELLREGGIRMPTVTGQAISIVGAVVLGQAAVEAGLVSAATVIVVGITAIANFVTPSFSFGLAQRILQASFIFLSIALGLFGLFCGTFFMLIHLVSLKTTGDPYLTPLAPLKMKQFRDTIIRSPWYKLMEPKE